MVQFSGVRSCIVNEMREYGWGDFLAKIINQKPRNEILMNVFIKAFYEAWANNIFDQVPILGNFRGSNHNTAIEEFRDIDKKLNAESKKIVVQYQNRFQINSAVHFNEIRLFL